MSDTPLPPSAFLREALEYDPETGNFRWKRRPVRHFQSSRAAGMWNTRFAGTAALTVHHSGYRKGGIMFGSVRYVLYAHRVAYFLATEQQPDQVDHVNGDRSDNRLANLRAATQQQNQRNRPQSEKRGLPKGVSLEAGRFMARARNARGRSTFLGSFDTPKEAHAAYVAFARPIHGEFFNPGAPVESIFD